MAFNSLKLLYFMAFMVLCYISKTYVSAEQVKQFVFVPKCTEMEKDLIESHLGTKTPYRAIANWDVKPLEYEGCQPRRIWALFRHGTRNPSEKVIRQAKTDMQVLKQRILNNLKNRLCSEEVSRLKSWNFKAFEEEEKFLVAEGEEEAIALAERMQKRFPDILPDYYDPHLYYFKYTKTQRTEKSAESFAIGLFGRENIKAIQYPEPLDQDPVLRFYKLCRRWENDINRNRKTFINNEKFLKEPEMLDALNFVKHKTQLANITQEEVKLMYTICAFETAWSSKLQKSSIWCNFFNHKTLKALEFAADLKYFWKDGYGSKLTQKIACPAIADLFESIKPSSSKPNATLYFTHSGTILKVLAHLGLYNDLEPLTYKDFKKDRSWRTSVIDAFASNIAFVLYECDDEPKVLTLHQERPVRLPGCPQTSDLCNLSTLEEIYANSLNKCNFKEICEA